MKLNLKPFLLLLCLILILGFFLLNWFFKASFSEEKFLNLLFVKKTENGRILETFVMHYAPKDHYLYVYLVNSKTTFYRNSKKVSINQLKKSSQVRRFVETLLKIEIHGTFVLSHKKAMRLMRLMGAVPFFNQHSNAFEKGFVVINHENYDSFLAGVKNPIVKRDVAYSIWVNSLLQNGYFFKDFKSFVKLIYMYYFHFRTNISMGNFVFLVKNLVSGAEDLYLTKSNMNVEKVEIEGEKRVLPFKNGEYDREKLKRVLTGFHNKFPSKNKYPITIQVKNTTSIKRMAAKTSGLLRTKRCNVLEYLNAPVKLKHSVIIDRSGSPVKRKYFSKITKVSNIYYSVDHRENFDFSLYIGEDYYAIPFLSDRR